MKYVILAIFTVSYAVLTFKTVLEIKVKHDTVVTALAILGVVGGIAAAACESMLF